MQSKHVALVLVATLIALAGCSGLTNTPTESPAPITVDAVDATPENPDVTLSVEYNAVVTDTIPTEPRTVAEDGYVWLAVHTHVTNDGSGSWDVASYPFSATFSGNSQTPTSVGEPWAIGEDATILTPGETATGWLIYHIQADAESATLEATEPTQRTFAIDYNHNSSIGTTLPG